MTEQVIEKQIEVADLEQIDTSTGDVAVEHHGLEKPEDQATVYNTARSIESVGTPDEPAFLVNQVVKIYNFNDCEEGIDYSIDFDSNVMDEEQATELASITMQEIFKSASDLIEQQHAKEVADLEKSEGTVETETSEEVEEVVEVTVD